MFTDRVRLERVWLFSFYGTNIVITYNFKDIAGMPQVTKEYVKDIEQQIESADPSAVSFIKSSHISLARTPKRLTLL